MVQAEQAQAKPSEATAAVTEPALQQVPERPLRAPGVELSGMMGEGGFKDQQWLVERDGRFLQLTELLYRILEQVDGDKDLDAIAAAVSASAGRGVSADNVRQLLQRKLIPLGLVARADGSIAATPGSGGAGRSLRVNMKMARISPRVIEPLIAVLHLLYVPPVLIAAVLAGLAVEWWVFFVHGVGGSVRDALTAPGLLLAALGIIVLAAAFHELGHAAALRHGGGKVRGMGAGVYLVYPVFYTDVSDNYRLGRWARVRTDLGGFYFNLLFALAVMAVYALTGLRFLLIVVVLIDFDIIRQLMPFVRLDGYWALADLTGVPDFFSQMGPFLRTVLPLPFWKGRRLPGMKGWVKAVFALYMLVTVPLLGLLLFATIRSLPRVLATAWVAFSGLAGELHAALGAANVLAAAAAAVQIVALALPTVGMLFIVYSLGSSVFGGLWRWSKPSLPRRIIGGLSGAAIAGAIALLWLPQLPALLPVIGGRQNPVHAQAAAAFRPIGPGEKGTLADAVPALPGGRSDPTLAEPAATPAPARTTKPVVSPTARAAPRPAVPATPQASVPAGVGATPAASASPTRSATPSASEGAASPTPRVSATPPPATGTAPIGNGTVRSTPGTPSPTAEQRTPTASAPGSPLGAGAGSNTPAVATTTPSGRSSATPAPATPTAGTTTVPATAPAAASATTIPTPAGSQ